MEKDHGNGKKKYPGKLAESGVFYVSIPDPRMPINTLEHGLYEIPAENQIRIPVIFDYTEFDPNYLDGDSWWNFDTETNITHVMVGETLRARFVNLMEKEKLTKEENNELDTYKVIMNSLPATAAGKALERYASYLYKILENQEYDAGESDKTDAENAEKKEYRTKAKAGDVAEVPAKMPLITNQTYINAMTYNDDNAAYLQPLKSADGLMFKDNKLFFDGLPASTARIKHLYTKDNIEEFDLPLLRVFYAVILNKFKQTWIEDKSIDETITIYYPDLARQLGKSMNISRKDVEATINSILSFRNIMGITEKGNNILPVLVYMGEDREKNTITFASPYIVKIIKDLYKASIRKNKQGLAMKKKDGSPQMLPAYTYLPSLTLAKERNKKAVEIVCIVVPVIENAGSHGTPHISARTIIERNQMLKQSLENTSDTSNQNKILKRAFGKAWELLVTQTDLSVKYKNIQLPIIPNSSIKDPKEKKRLEREFRTKWIPTMSNLDMVFEFPHEGKIKG